MNPQSPLLQHKHFQHPPVFLPENLMRETRRQKALAVEMEAASLYAFAEARQQSVVCFAHITNRMGVSEGDFEKGEADGTVASLRLIEVVAKHWLGTANGTGLVKE
jgi:hypothetical protein